MVLFGFDATSPQKKKRKRKEKLDMKDHIFMQEVLERK